MSSSSSWGAASASASGSFSRRQIEGHVIVREGVLFEAEFKDDAVALAAAAALSAPRSPLQNGIVEDWDLDDLEPGHSEAAQHAEEEDSRPILRWQKKDVLLFANGNLIIKPHRRKGFHIWPFSRDDVGGSSQSIKSPYEYSRVVCLEKAGFKQVEFDRKARQYMFRIFPNKGPRSVVLGLASEKGLKSWFRDILGVAAAAKPRKGGLRSFAPNNRINGNSGKSGSDSSNGTKKKSGFSPAEIERAKESWQQAFFQVHANIEDLPLRHWNAEFDPNFLRGDAMKAYRLWRDFTSFVLEYVSKSQDGSIQLNVGGQHPFFFQVGGSKFEASPSTPGTRAQAAMQLFFDSKGVLLVLKGNEDSTESLMQDDLQLVASCVLPGSLMCFASPNVPSLFDVDVPQEPLDFDTSPFAREIRPRNLYSGVGLLVRHDGSTLGVHLPTSKATKQAAILGLLGVESENVVLRAPQGSARFLYVSGTRGTGGASAVVNRLASQLLEKEVRGNVLMTFRPEPTFEHHMFKAAFLRPEYPSLRLELFREFFMRLRDGPQAEKQIMFAEKSITNDVYVHCVFAAALRALNHEGLIQHPRQIATILHAHAVPFDLAAIMEFCELVGPRMSRLLDADMALHSMQGNLEGALTYLSNTGMRHDGLLSRMRAFTTDAKLRIIHAWLRLSGQLLSVESLLKGLTQVDSLMGLEDFLDERHAGENDSLLEFGNAEMFIQRLSRGANRCTIRDSVSEFQVQFPFRGRDPFSLCSMALNHLDHSVKHNETRYTRKEMHAAPTALSMYASHVSVVFGPRQEAPLRSPKSSKQPQRRQIPSWWLLKRAVSADAVGGVSWIKVMLTRAQNYVNSTNGNENLSFDEDQLYQTIHDALGRAEECSKRSSSAVLVAVILSRAVLARHVSDIIFGIMVAKAQHFVPCSDFVVVLMNTLLVHPKTSWDAKQRSFLENLVLRLGQVPRISPINRAKLLKRTILRREPLRSLVYENDTMPMNHNLDELFQSLFSMTPNEFHASFTFNCLMASYVDDNSADGAMKTRRSMRDLLKGAADTLNRTPTSSYREEEDAESMSSANETEEDLAAAAAAAAAEEEDGYTSSGSVMSLASSNSEQLMKSGTSVDTITKQKGPLYTRVVVEGAVQGMSLEEEQVLADDLNVGGDILKNFEDDSEDDGEDMDLSMRNHENRKDMQRNSLTSFLRKKIDLTNGFLPPSFDIVHVSCGARHSAIVSRSGLLFSFGFGGAGRLGHGNEESTTVPTLVQYFALRSIFVRHVDCGRDHTAAVGTHANGQPGTAFAWGWGEAGRLGQGVEVGVQSSPLQIETFVANETTLEVVPDAMLEIVKVACGREHTLFLTESGQVFSCGVSMQGRLGLGHEGPDRLSPTRIRGNLEDDVIVDIAAGDAHSLAVSKSGVVFSWGFGESGALGHGDNESRFDPKRVAMLQDSRFIVQIACGGYHSAALDSNGRVWTWGDGVNGQLGVDSGTAQGEQETMIPRMVRFTHLKSAVAKIEKIACGRFSTLALDSDGNLCSWGFPEVVGSGPRVPILKQLGRFRDKTLFVRCFSAGTYHSIVVLRNSKRRPRESAESLSSDPDLQSIRAAPTITSMDHMDRVIVLSEETKMRTQQGAFDVANFNHETASPGLRTLFCGSLDDNESAVWETPELIQLNHDLLIYRGSSAEMRKSRSLGKSSNKTKIHLGPMHLHQPRYTARQPSVIVELNGSPTVDAAGDLFQWQIVKADGSVFRLGLNDAHALRSPSFGLLGISVKTVSCSGRNSWFGCIGKRPPATEEDLPSSRLILWQNYAMKKATSSNLGTFTPLLTWPSHDDIVLSDVDVGPERVVLADSDGVVFEIVPPIQLNQGEDESPEPSPSNGARRSKRRPRKDTVEVGATDTLREMTIERIQRLYLKYSPEKIRNNPGFLDTMLRLYEGRNNELLQLLIEKYGNEPSEREAFSPTGFAREHPRIVNFPERTMVTQVACGEKHSFALTSKGKLYAWGDHCAARGLGWNRSEYVTSPMPVISKLPASYPNPDSVLIVRIASGPHHALAVTLGGLVLSWGDGHHGALGRGHRASLFEPTLVDFFPRRGLRIARAACGSKHSAVVTTCGKAFTFGFSVNGQLGLPERDPSNRERLPTLVLSPRQVQLLDSEASDERKQLLFATNVFAARTSTIFVATNTSNKAL